MSDSDRFHVCCDRRDVSAYDVSVYDVIDNVYPHMVYPISYIRICCDR